MAFKANIFIDLKGILVLVLLTVRSKATNIDCYEKSFHCVNSTHFMICVDLGTGISTTIDDVIIPCPPPTVCSRRNRYECEFPPPLISSTTTVNTVATEINVASVTTSIPYEEYFDTVGTTTLAESVPRHSEDIVSSTEKITENNTPKANLNNDESNLTVIPYIASISNIYQELTTKTVKIEETTPFFTWNTSYIGTVSTNLTSVLSENERKDEYIFSTEFGFTPEYTTEAAIATKAPVTEYNKVSVVHSTKSFPYENTRSTDYSTIKSDNYGTSELTKINHTIYTSNTNNLTQENIKPEVQPITNAENTHNITVIDYVSIVDQSMNFQHDSTKAFPYENATSADYPTTSLHNYVTSEVTKDNNTVYTSNTNNLNLTNIKAEIPVNTSFTSNSSFVKQSVNYESSLAATLPRINKDSTTTTETAAIVEVGKKVNSSYTSYTSNLTEPITNVENTNNKTVIDNANIVDQSKNFPHNSTKAFPYENATNADYPTTTSDNYVTSEVTKENNTVYSTSTNNLNQENIKAEMSVNASFTNTSSFVKQSVTYELSLGETLPRINKDSTTTTETPVIVEVGKKVNSSYTSNMSNLDEFIKNVENRNNKTVIDNASIVSQSMNFQHDSTKAFPYENATNADYPTTTLDNYVTSEVTKENNTVYSSSTNNLNQENIKAEMSVNASFTNTSSFVKQSVTYELSLGETLPRINKESTTTTEAAVFVEVGKIENSSYTSNTSNLAGPITNVENTISKTVIDNASIVDQSMNFQQNLTLAFLPETVTSIEHSTIIPETTVTADAKKDPATSYAQNTMIIPNARPGNASFVDDAGVVDQSEKSTIYFVHETEPINAPIVDKVNDIFKNVHSTTTFESMVEVTTETNTTKKAQAINDTTERLLISESKATNDSPQNNEHITSTVQITGIVEATKIANTNYTQTNLTRVITNTEAYQKISNFSKYFLDGNAVTDNTNINPEMAVDRSFIDDTSFVRESVNLKTKSAIDFPPQSNSNNVYSATIPDINVEIITETNTNYTSTTTNLYKAIINVDMPVDSLFAGAAEQTIDYVTNTTESTVIVGKTKEVNNTDTTITYAEKPINASLTNEAIVIKPLVTNDISNSEYNIIKYEAQKINNSSTKHDMTTNITTIVTDRPNKSVTETHNKSYTDIEHELSTNGKLDEIRLTAETSTHIIVIDIANSPLNEKVITKNTNNILSILLNTTSTKGQPKPNITLVDTFTDKATFNFTETNVDKDNKTNKPRPNNFQNFQTKTTTTIEKVNEYAMSPSISTTSTELNAIKVAGEINYPYLNNITITPLNSFTSVEFTTENASMPETVTKSNFKSTSNDILLDENTKIELLANKSNVTDTNSNLNNIPITNLNEVPENKTLAILDLSTRTRESIDFAETLTTTSFNTLEMLANVKTNQTTEETMMAQNKNFSTSNNVNNIIPTKMNSNYLINRLIYETSTTAVELILEETTEFSIGEIFTTEVSSNSSKPYMTLPTSPVRNESIVLKGMVQSNHASKTNNLKTQFAEGSPKLITSSVISNDMLKKITEHTEKTVSINMNQMNITETEQISKSIQIAEQSPKVSGKVQIQSLFNVKPVDISTSLPPTEINKTKATDITSDYTLLEIIGSFPGYDTTNVSHTHIVTEASPKIIITNSYPEMMLPSLNQASNNILSNGRFQNNLVNKTKDHVTTEITPVSQVEIQPTSKTMSLMVASNVNLRRSIDNSVSNNTFVNEATKQIPVTEKSFLPSSTFIPDDSKVSKQEMFLYTITSTAMVTTEMASTIITENIISKENNVKKVLVATDSNFTYLNQIKNTSHFGFPVLTINEEQPSEAVSNTSIQTEGDKKLTISNDKLIAETASGDKFRNIVQKLPKPETNHPEKTFHTSSTLETEIAPIDLATIASLAKKRINVTAESTETKNTTENSMNEKQIVENNHNSNLSLSALRAYKNESISSNIITQIESDKQLFGIENALQNKTEGVEIINYSDNQPLKVSKTSTVYGNQDSSIINHSAYLDGIVTTLPGEILTSNLQFISLTNSVTEPSNTLNVKNRSTAATDVSSSLSGLKPSATYSTTISSLLKYDTLYTQKINSHFSDNHNNDNENIIVSLQITNKKQFSENLNNGTSGTAIYTENKNSIITKPMNVEIIQTSAVTKPNELTVTKAIKSHTNSGQTKSGRNPTVSKQKSYISSTLEKSKSFNMVDFTTEALTAKMEINEFKFINDSVRIPVRASPKNSTTKNVQNNTNTPGTQKSGRNPTVSKQESYISSTLEIISKVNTNSTYGGISSTVKNTPVNKELGIANSLTTGKTGNTNIGREISTTTKSNAVQQSETVNNETSLINLKTKPNNQTEVTEVLIKYRGKNNIKSLLLTSSEPPSDVLVVTPIETEKTHSGIVAQLSATSKEKNNFEHEKTNDKGSVTLEKSKSFNVVDFTTEALTAKMEINVFKFINDSVRIPVRVSPKNSTTKNVQNNTNTTAREFNKEALNHRQTGNSIASTHEDSRTSNNKSLDQNTRFSQAHNMSVISPDQSGTSYNTPQTKTAVKDARATRFPAPKLTNPKSNVFSCKNKKRGKHSDGNDCRKFYICLGNNQVVSGACPVNTVFSEINKQCTKNLSHCIRNNQFRCVNEGRFSDFLNDNVYYLCVKNNVSHFIRFKLLCQNGYRLDKTSVRCVLNTELTSTSDMSKSVSEQSLSSNKRIDHESENNFSCEEEGKYPDPKNCRSYYVCTKNSRSEFRRRKRKCDSDEIFHKDKKKCVDADSYEC